MQNNYYSIYEGQIEEAKRKNKKPRLLLHACCAPCSSHCIEQLSEIFDITMFFYNPNIDEKVEYMKRYKELLRFIEEAPFAKGVKAVDFGYDKEKFYEMARGREMLPERGARCYDCYMLRMREAAKYAALNGFDYFTTTLSISPYKNAEWINEIGIKLEEELQKEGVADVCHKVSYLFSDFKKKSGYARSIELSKEYDLYRQDYCGCIYSKRDRDLKIAEREKKEEKLAQ